MENHRLTVSDGTSTVTLPCTKNIVHGGSLESTDVIMASGKIKSDIIGFRQSITYVYSYIPAQEMAKLHDMLRRRKFFECKFLDIDNIEKTGIFKIDYPKTNLFMYKKGVAVWKDATLLLTSQEVIR